MNTFLIGQRVIVDNQICVCIEEPDYAKRFNDDCYQWVRRPNGLEQWFAVSNIKPLPNGQL